MKKLSALIEIVRPKQWYKNLVIFLGVVFSHNLFVNNMLIKSIFAFILISMFSGIGYIINDVIDLEKDKQHPTKKNRPLPSGRIEKDEAVMFAIFLFLIATYFSFQLNYLFGIVSLIFFLISLLYSFSLRNLFLIDAITIAVNFTLRAILGVVVIDVYLSPWLVLCTFLLALFLALGKRRSELNFLGKKAIKHRKVLKYYNSSLTDSLLVFSMATLFISYCIYCAIVQTNTIMMFTIPFVTFLLFKYMYYIFSNHRISMNTELIFKDKQMLIGMVVCGILVLVALYGV